MVTTKCAILILSISLLCFAAIPLQAAETAEDPGKKAFVDNKCNVCHSVSEQGITKKTGGTSTAKTGPPDLSGVGATNNADFFVKYMKKEAMLHDKKHTKGWTGKEEELQAIAKWLESLKKPAAK